MAIGSKSADKPDKESPLRRPPLRQAGQSLQEELDRIRDDKVLEYIFLAAFLVALAGIEWWRYFFRPPPQPWLYSIIAVLGSGFAAYKLRPLLRQLQHLKLGRDGERTVGQELEKLRGKGYRVYHDYLGDGYNIDHIVIGPTGIFTINTKAIGKPKDPKARIDYDGQTLRIPGTRLDRDPIAQAKAERDEVRKFIRENANRKVPVRPAVVFVGWFTTKQPEGAEVWVLNVNGLLSFIEHEHVDLSQDDINHISGILEAHILLKQRNRYDKLNPSWRVSSPEMDYMVK